MNGLKKTFFFSLNISQCIYKPNSILSRPGQSQELLYKHCCDSLAWIYRLRAQLAKNGAFSPKLEYVAQVLKIQSVKVHQNHIISSLGISVFLNRLILPVGGFTLEGCTSSL